jgi:hypothetical protein
VNAKQELHMSWLRHWQVQWGGLQVPVKRTSEDRRLGQIAMKWEGKREHGESDSEGNKSKVYNFAQQIWTWKKGKRSTSHVLCLYIDTLIGHLWETFLCSAQQLAVTPSLRLFNHSIFHGRPCHHRRQHLTGLTLKHLAGACKSACHIATGNAAVPSPNM